MIQTKTLINVPFHDIDIMNIAWHGHYLKYFELARTDLMQQLGLDWPQVKELGFAMPVVDISINYRRPLTYGRSYVVETTLDDTDLPELVLYYEIRDQRTKKVHSTGRSRQVYMDVQAKTLCFTIPPQILERLKSYGQSN